VIPSIVLSRGRRRSIGIFALAFSALFLTLTPSYPQQSPPQAEPAAQAQAAPAAKPQGGNSISSRIGRLEQQFLDLQVSVSTLASLLRAKSGSVLPQESGGAEGAVSSAAIGDVSVRVGALETQIGALSSQLNQIVKQMSAIQAKLAATSSAAPTQAAAPQAEAAPPVQQSEASPPPAPAEQAPASATEDTSKPRGFGAPPGDAPTRATADSEPQPLAPLTPHGEAPSTAPDKSSQTVTAGIPNSDAQSLYEHGYGSMLQRDYGTAETSFRQLIASYPNEPLAGSAQYWIGESYYARGQYKSAADASLAELGQKDPACSTFNELAAKFPQAPEHILDQAKGERKKSGC
jgi:TolA-binding protein